MLFRPRRDAAVQMTVALALVAALLAGCGGGGGSSSAAPSTPTAPEPAPTPSPPLTSYTISGTIAVTETSAVDSDSNDPNQPSRADNGTFEGSQALPNPVQLIGYLTMPGEGPAGPASTTGDLVDGYRLFLDEGQVVELEFAADPGRFDIDLYVFDAGRAIRGQSVGLNKYECVRIDAPGEYFLGVQIFAEGSAGGSIYQLRIGAPGSGSACPNATGAADLLIPNEIVAEASVPGGGRPGGVRKSLDDVVILKGDLAQPRPVLLQMPAGHSARGATVERLRTAAKSAAGRASQPQDARSQDARSQLARSQLARSQLAQASRDAWRRGMPARTAAITQTLDDAKLLVASGDFIHAVPNFRLKALQTLAMEPFPPNDRDYAKQRWHYDAIELQGAVASLQGVDLSASPRPVVAVVDTGIVATHPDLANQLVAGYDFVSDAGSAGDGSGNDADPDDASHEAGFSFHGTHVAGTIVAQTYNDIGGAGVAPVARVMPVRVLGTSGSGTLYDILQGIRFAAGMATDAGVIPPQRADIINLSLGTDGVACDAMLQKLFSDVRALGVLVVAASGNASRPGMSMPVGLPANCPNVFAVAATDALNGRAPYSNAGPENFIAAPGGDLSKSTTGSGLPDGIYSAMASIDNTGNRLSTYGYLQGTSMATPHVSGVLALMRWANPSLTARAIEQMVSNGSIVDDLGSSGRDSVFGYGLVNARRAVDAALAAGGGNEPPAGGLTQAQPRTISLGSVRTEAEFVLAHVGSSNERVVSVVTDSPVITVEPKPGAVDPLTGLGVYRVRANRAAMTVGSAAFPDVIVQLLPARSLRLQVAIERRSSAMGQGNLGPAYLLVLDAEDPARTLVAQAVASAPVGGMYSYTVTVPGTAAVSLLAGSDLDNNGVICSAGEACGAYPMLSSQLEVLRPPGNLTGIDFTLAPFGGISPDAGDARR